MWSSSFRKELHGHCHLTMAVQDEFPYYDVLSHDAIDELQNALVGISKVQNSENGSGSSFGEGQFDEFMVLQPNFWKSKNLSKEFVFHDEILIDEEMIKINDSFTFDLDLYF